MSGIPLLPEPAIMAVVNVTNDSFSGDGLLASPQHWTAGLVDQSAAAEASNAAIIDIGAESTRPGAVSIDAAREKHLITEALLRIRAETSLPISVDTMKASVAAAACDLGATAINDVTGLQNDPEVADVAAEFETDLILVHNTAFGATVESDPVLGSRFASPPAPDDIVKAVVSGLERSIEVATARGVELERIWIDPGLGFGKTHAENLALTLRIRELETLCGRIVVGPSRKSFIGWALNLPPNERLEGTAAVVAMLAERRVPLIRVHDYLAMSRVVMMINALMASSTT